MTASHSSVFAFRNFASSSGEELSKVYALRASFSTRAGSTRALARSPLIFCLRTSSGSLAMFPLGTSPLSIEHNIGALQKHLWNRDAYGPRSFKIDRQLELRGLFYG